MCRPGEGTQAIRVEVGIRTSTSTSTSMSVSMSMNVSMSIGKVMGIARIDWGSEHTQTDTDTSRAV